MSADNSPHAKSIAEEGSSIYAYEGAVTPDEQVKAEALAFPGSDPSISYSRSGYLRYLLFPGLQELRVQSRGDVPHRHWQLNGGENHCQSMLYFNEMVAHFALDPNLLSFPANEKWDFAGSREFSWEVNSAIMAGGHDHGSNLTKANADYSVTATNTFTIGPDADPVRQFLFYGCPTDTHPPAFKPLVKRARASASISCIRESTNQALYEFRIPASFHNGGIKVLPLQNILREMHPNLPLVGETLRLEYRMTCYGEAAGFDCGPTGGQDESKWIIVGAVMGFAVLPMRRLQ